MPSVAASASRSNSPNTFPTLENLPESPFPIGLGPFRIKGTVFWGYFEYIEDFVPGGLRAVKDRLPSDALREFCDQTFLAAGWYDFSSFLHLLVAAAVAADMRPARFIGDHAIWQAKRDVRGVHRLLIKLVSPEAVAERFPVAFSRYFDFAEVGVTVDKGKAATTVSGLPVLFRDWYRASVGPAANALLELAGAKQVATQYSPFVEDGVKHGVKTVRFSVTRTWSR